MAKNSSLPSDKPSGETDFTGDVSSSSAKEVELVGFVDEVILIKDLIMRLGVEERTLG